MKKTLVLTLIFAALCSFVSAEVYSLYDPSYIYVKDDKMEGNLKWKDTVSAGIEVGKVKEIVVPAKVNKKDNKNEYARIDYKGKEAYILARGLIESKGKVSVIKKDTVIYTWKNLATFENVIIKAGTVVIVEGKNADSKTNLQKISFFDDLVFWKMRAVYVSGDALSTDKNDYDAVSLAKVAMTKNPETEREVITKLLSSAESKAKSSEIKDFVAKVAAKIDGEDIKQSPVEDYQDAGTITSDGAKVNVREAPGKSAKSVGQVEDGTFIRASKKTTQEESIAGETAAWYYISTEGDEPTQGWVFGSCITWQN